MGLKGEKNQMLLKKYIKELKEYLKTYMICSPQHNLALKILVNIAELNTNAEIIYMDTDSIFIK